MSKKVLVAYASKHHSTAEIAGVIGEVLRQKNSASVQVQSVDSVLDVTSYDAIILGSAVYVGQWQAEAGAFLKKYEAELVKRPVWIFSSGPTGKGDPETLLKGWKFPQKLQPIVDRIKPRDVALFSGNLDPDKMSFVERGMIKMVKAPTGDFRDWDAIRNWAASIAKSI